MMNNSERVPMLRRELNNQEERERKKNETQEEIDAKGE